MPFFIPNTCYTPYEIRINTETSITYLLEMLLSIIIAKYSDKQIKYKSTSTSVSSLVIQTTYWRKFCKCSFIDFMESFNQYFMCYGESPFKVSFNKDTNYYLVFNYAESSFKFDEYVSFPSVTVIIEALLKKILYHPCDTYHYKMLIMCKLDGPLPYSDGHIIRFMPDREPPVTNKRSINELDHDMNLYLLKRQLIESVNSKSVKPVETHIAVEQPDVEESVTEEPVVEAPVVEEPVVEEPVVEAPVVEESLDSEIIEITKSDLDKLVSQHKSMRHVIYSMCSVIHDKDLLEEKVISAIKIVNSFNDKQSMYDCLEYN